MIVELDGKVPSAAEVAALLLPNHGHFTTMRVSGSAVVGLDLHLARLTRDSEALFGSSVPPDSVRALMRRAAEQTSQPVLVRTTIIRDDVSSLLRTLVTTREVVPPPPGGLRVRTVPWVRDQPAVKHVALFGASRRRVLAQAAGFDDALFVTPTGLLAEGPTWNVGVVLAGTLVWPDDACLPGTTRALLQLACDAAGLPWARRPVPVTELPAAEAVVATSAGQGIRPITQVDALPFPRAHPLLPRLQAAYAALPPTPL